MPIDISPTSLILVAIMKDPRDMEIARLLGWYRIPLRRAPKVIAVDHLAFYQTGAFGDDKWRIQYTAPVRGYELTTREALLRDESNHPYAKHEYYKIQIGPLTSLPMPIEADKWRRVTFLYTTGEYLLKAKTVNDLVVHTDERVNLWRALKDRIPSEQAYGQVAVQESDINGKVLAELLGILSIEQ